MYLAPPLTTTTPHTPLQEDPEQLAEALALSMFLAFEPLTHIAGARVGHELAFAMQPGAPRTWTRPVLRPTY